MTHEYPMISIVTPSYNQGGYLDEAIVSVLSQGYPNLEYIVVDGGSTDNSVDIIRKHKDKLAYWVSEADGGQYDALQKGFAKTTGSIMAWLNSDDKYTPWAFSIVADIFSSFPEVEWLSTLYPISWNRSGHAAGLYFHGGFDRKFFFRGGNLAGRGWKDGVFIQQESTFWRRSLWERAGGYVDSAMKLAGDFELWARFYGHADLYGVAALVGGFRTHGNQKTSHHMAAYLAEAEETFRRYGGNHYNKLESALHGIMRPLINGRALRWTPRTLVSLLLRTGIIYPTKVCRWGNDNWEISTNYIA